tara:strand:+ start:206 stop:685 length:480 start_codon:yes stop_codon:yes gene_type:complete
MIKNCPDCGALLKEKHISENKCWKCGSTSILEAIEKEKKEAEKKEAGKKEEARTIEKKVENKTFEDDDNQLKDYPAIRFLSKVSSFFAWAGIFIGLIGFGIWMDNASIYTDDDTKILMFLAFALGTFIFFIYWKAISELLIILVDMARDFRRIRLNKKL